MTLKEVFLFPLLKIYHFVFHSLPDICSFKESCSSLENLFVQQYNVSS